MKIHDVVVVGGGAAGLIASIAANQQGANVCILERNERIGKKILATGNGRCNYTNLDANIDNYYSQNKKFVYGPLNKFNVEKTLNFFESIGISPQVENENKVFPYSEQASSFLDVFLYELSMRKIDTITNFYVKDIIKKKQYFELKNHEGECYKAKKVILTTGGKAMPSSGSDGNGYKLAKQMGHNIIEPRPSLVQIKLDSPYLKGLQGVKIKGSAEIISNNKSIIQDSGDILFTSYGISGPPILQLSRTAGQLLDENKFPLLKINIFDNMNFKQVNILLKNRFIYNPDRSIEFSLVGLINKRLIRPLLKESQVDDFNKKVANLSETEIKSIASTLIDWKFKIIGLMGWTNAQVTAGGIDTNEINPSTMESKKQKGIYYAGEIIDVDGQCGGFNLQWAWSTGYIAGYEAAQSF